MALDSPRGAEPDGSPLLGGSGPSVRIVGQPDSQDGPTHATSPNALAHSDWETVGV